ncbi:MAG TPA: hypothetical protein DC049_04740 [Spirochaetia bacterium]|nr:hypothetical protein [Spirochaetia bacterium]
MIIKKSIGIFSIFILLVIFFAAVWPLIKSGSIIDYDGGAAVNTVNYIIYDNNYHYGNSRPPGCPVYEFVSALIYYPFKNILSPKYTRIFMQYFSLLLSMLTIAVFYLKIKNLDKNPLLCFLAVLTMGLHPVFIWLSFSSVEEAFALFLMILAWKLAENNKTRIVAVILTAMALASKVSSFALIPLILSEFLDEKDTANPYKIIKKTAIPLGSIIFLGLLLFMPVLVANNMNFKKVFTTIHYGTPPADRPYIGTSLGRITILWWIPVSIWIIGFYLIKMIKIKKIPEINKYDFFILSFLLLILSPGLLLLKLTTVVFLIYMLVFYYRQEKNNPEFMLNYWKNIFTGAAFALSLLAPLLAPYSRSFFYFTLIPLICLLILRFKNIYLWAVMIIISFLPMFFYYHIDLQAMAFNRHGFYRAHINNRDNDYNDFGYFNSNPKTRIIYYPWSKMKKK